MLQEMNSQELERVSRQIDRLRKLSSEISDLAFSIDRLSANIGDEDFEDVVSEMSGFLGVRPTNGRTLEEEIDLLDRGHRDACQMSSFSQMRRESS